MLLPHAIRYLTSEPMMDADDRRALRRCAILIAAIIAITSAPAWPQIAKADGVRYLPHPRGCPARAFCGCGAAVEIFGRPVRELWLARNWFRFPRTSPAPGKVAVRRNHVMVLKRHLHGNVWLTADYNSGGHRSRLHARSIARFTIVDPLAVNIAEARP